MVMLCFFYSHFPSQSFRDENFANETFSETKTKLQMRYKREAGKQACMEGFWIFFPKGL